MYVGRDFDPSDNGESERFSFDFVNDIEADDTITAAVWTCGVAAKSAGQDGNAAACIDGLALFTGTKTTQRVSALQPGVIYMLRADVTTAKGDVVALWSHVECKAPA